MFWVLLLQGGIPIDLEALKQQDPEQVKEFLESLGLPPDIDDLEKLLAEASENIEQLEKTESGEVLDISEPVKETVPKEMDQDMAKDVLENLGNVESIMPKIANKKNGSKPGTKNGDSKVSSKSSKKSKRGKKPKSKG